MAQVFKYEELCGLKDQVAKDLSVAFLLEPVKIDVIGNELTFQSMTRAAEEYLKQIDLFYFESVLASTGWNKNDDIFLKAELWAARSSPINKKINYMHNERDIIGHIITSFAFDTEQKSLAFELTNENIPDNFNLCVGGVLYKIFEESDLQSRINKIIAEIAEGKWKVSMECLFTGFDYGLVSASGEHKIIQRTNETSFLTKYLRRYGGKGEYEGYKIGRALRGMTFSGKGLVTNPANPQSVIIKSDNTQFNGQTAANEILNEVTIMADSYTKEQYEELKTKLELAQASEKATAEKRVNDEMTALKSTIKELESTKAKLESDLTVSKDIVKAHEAKVTNLEGEFNKIKDELAKASEKIAKSEKEALKSKRLAMFADVQLEPAKAQELVDKFADASDVMFDELVKALPRKTATAAVPVTTPTLALATATIEPTLNTVPSVNADNVSKASAWLSNMFNFDKKNQE